MGNRSSIVCINSVRQLTFPRLEHERLHDATDCDHCGVQFITSSTGSLILLSNYGRLLPNRSCHRLSEGVQRFILRPSLREKPSTMPLSELQGRKKNHYL